MNDTWTVRSVLAWIENHLHDRSDPNPRLSAQWLVASALDCSRIELYADIDRPLTLGEREVLRDYTRRRASGEPLQYITGSTDFRFVTLAVQPGVLIPRPETEVLVSEAIAELGLSCHPSAAEEGPTILDLCTGSGNIACAIAWELKGAQVTATDISFEAVDLARRNAASLGFGERVNVVECDLADGLPCILHGSFDLVVSNPPYIPTAEIAQLDREVSRFEPRLALDGGPDGLDLFRRILPVARDFLRSDGVLAVELHEDTLECALQLARRGGFRSVRVAKDLAGRPRVLVAHRSESEV